MRKIVKGYNNIRLKNYDYHSGWFFVTNKTNFGKDNLVDNLYQLVKEELINLSKKTLGVKIDYFKIMPNHIHVILIFNNAVLPLSEFWRRFKAITTLKAKKQSLTDNSLWQKNYFEHVIRNENALNKIREYLKRNPYEENLPWSEIYEDDKINA